MNTIVSMPNTKAWIRPIKNSNIMIIEGTIVNAGISEPTSASKTMPANILPNNRNANDKIFENSEISSSNPTRKSIAPKKGFLNKLRTLKNLSK